MKSILVIEDVTEVRENVCEILELSGYQVFAAENGSQGIEQANRELPDLIICDVMMPRIDGYGVLKILRANQATNHIPFIFLTARVEKEDFRKGMGLGADDYITKPFDDTELLEAIETRLVRQEKNNEMFTQPGKIWHSDAQIDKWVTDLIDNYESSSLYPSCVIFQEDKSPKNIHYIQSGLVKEVYKTDEGKQLITGLYGPGTFIGISAAIKNEKYTGTTMAISKGQSTVISIDDFLEMLSTNRLLNKFCLQLMNAELLVAKTTKLSHAYNSVRKKVADALVVFHQYRDQENNLLASRDDLAMLSGVAKETLIRTLSAFKSESLITLEHKKIKVLNLQELSNLPQ